VRRLQSLLLWAIGGAGFALTLAWVMAK